MIHFRIGILITLVAFVNAGAQVPEGVFEEGESRVASGVAEGQSTLSPNQLRVAEVGDFELTYTVGASGISEGGGLYVDFPKSWFTNPTPLVKPMQQDTPDGFHYVGVTSSNPGVRLKMTMDRVNINGKTERFRHLMDIRVEGVALREHDKVYVRLAHTTAPYIVGSDEVHVAVDATGTGSYWLTEHGASYTVASGPASRVRVTVPSQGVVRDPVDLHVTVFDRHDNVANAFRGQVRITGLTKQPINMLFREEQAGNASLSWTPTEAGYFFPNISAGDMTSSGGPIRIYETEPKVKTYWGDLHSHSTISKDGIGSGDYAYARDVAHLDFFASTEHDISDNSQDSITPSEWEQIQNTVRAYYAPGTFVTMLAYECSLRTGHHNVFYRGLDGVPWPGHRLLTLENIWAKLEAGEAFTVPHHLGIAWGRGNLAPTSPELQEILTRTTPARGGPQVFWDTRHDEALRPLLEIYSKHGNSESFAPNDLLAYEQVRYTGATSVEGPHYARDAWGMGHVLGTIAASDNHRAQPGLAHTGLTAVRAPELTRDAVFDALLNRQAYGTTGERILLEFELAGVSMGQRTSATGKATGRIVVAAPKDIAYAEVLGTTKGEWNTIARWEPDGQLLEEEFSIVLPEQPAAYYLRTQLKGQTNSRIIRAWSSPIWVNTPGR